MLTTPGAASDYKAVIMDYFTFCFRFQRSKAECPRLPRTFLNGLILVVIWKSNLQSSHCLVSALLTHCCRQDWCTNLRLPEHTHGEMSGASGSDSQWQMRHTSWLLEVAEDWDPLRSVFIGVGELGPNVSWKATTTMLVHWNYSIFQNSQQCMKVTERKVQSADSL